MPSYRIEVADARAHLYRVTLTAGSLTILSAALVWTWQRL